MSVTETLAMPGGPTDTERQLMADGRLGHLLTLRDLDQAQITEILDRAEQLLRPPEQPAARSAALRGLTVGNLFFEPSTRTRSSFELAAKRLGADVLNLDLRTSSQQKGESILDTVATLQAMQVDIFIVRDATVGVPALIASYVNDHVAVLNAGEANVSHPTQGLLDLLTMRRHKGDLAKLKVAIVGDIAHSRVARSAAEGLRAVGCVDLRLVSPKALRPDTEHFPDAVLTDNLDDGIRDADVVMALRIQHERIDSLTEIPDSSQYFAGYGLSRARMQLAAPDAIVMHPGPMNRGVEIEPELADGPASVIVEQVRNGVAIRMAVLEAIVNNRKTL